QRLVPGAALVTPNAPEAERLTGRPAVIAKAPSAVTVFTSA
ncbi:MAG: hypothetical protein EBZ50_06755, partial [Alphaproteobacteria bacterium]|nr:hypothetical protein [Alphaproteobacteria bacterium]